MALTSYAIALGSNRRGRHGGPADTVRAAAQALDAERLSSIHATPALGPAGRGFANAAAIVETDLEPPDLLARLKSIARTFGRRGGRRWGPRVLDLDILLWSDGPYEGERSEEHTSELQSLMRNSYAVFCLKQKHTTTNFNHTQ